MKNKESSTINKTRKSLEKKEPVASGLIYFFALFSLLIVGMSFASIVDFWIEDHYDLPLHRSFFIENSIPGLSSYAKNVSWQLMAFLVFIILFVLDRRNLKLSPSLFNAKSRKKILTTLIVLGSFIIAIYLVIIVYSYLAGLSTPYAFVRIGVVLLILTLGMIFSYAELTQPNCVREKLYAAIVMGTLAVGALGSIVILQKYAPPKLMRKAQKDLQINENIRLVSKEMFKYYRQLKAFPQSLDILEEHHNLNSTLLDSITYKKLDNVSFEVCGDFKTDWKAARRIKQHWAHNKYTKGLNCRKYILNQEKNGTITLKRRTKKGIFIPAY